MFLHNHKKIPFWQNFSSSVETTNHIPNKHATKNVFWVKMYAREIIFGES